jgi:rhodanese-related sulfurtransferase
VQSGESTRIEPAELNAVAVRGRVLILDVRSVQEFASGHVEGAVNIPLDTIGSHASGLPRDRLIVTVCGKGGGRSDRAAQELVRGFKSVRSLCGGRMVGRNIPLRSLTHGKALFFERPPYGTDAATTRCGSPARSLVGPARK